MHDVRHGSASFTALKLASLAYGFSLYGKHINQTVRDGNHHRQPFPVHLGPRMSEAKVADLANRSARNDEVNMRLISNIPSPSMQDADKE